MLLEVPVEGESARDTHTAHGFKTHAINKTQSAAACG